MQEPGAIKQWLILPPLPIDNQDWAGASAALDTEQLPEEANLRPRAGETAMVGEIQRTWEAVQQEDKVIDFYHVLGEPNHSLIRNLAYGVCYIESDTDHTDLVMKLGSTDPLKVYLNGQEVHRQEGWTQAEETGIALRAGINVLVFKTVHRILRWRTWIWLTDAAGQPVKGIRVTLEPPEEL